MAGRVRADGKNKGEQLKVQIALALDQASQAHVQGQSRNQNYPLVASLQDLDQVAVGVKSVVDKVHRWKVQGIVPVENILRKGEEPTISEGMHIIVVINTQSRDTRLEKEAQIIGIAQKRSGQRLR